MAKRVDLKGLALEQKKKDSEQKAEQGKNRKAEHKKVRTTEQQNDRTTEQQKAGFVKVSFYIDKKQSQELDKLSLDLKHKEKYKSKSELIREAIDLILKKHGRT